MNKKQPCPCGSDTSYDQCCGLYHSGQWPGTAEQLMRSRYCAFVLNREDYLLKSWHSTTRPQTLNLTEQALIKWTGLSVLNHRQGDNTATVEFIARFKVNGKAQKIHELSRFTREDGRWFYVDGELKT